MISDYYLKLGRLNHTGFAAFNNGVLILEPKPMKSFIQGHSGSGLDPFKGLRCLVLAFLRSSSRVFMVLMVIPRMNQETGGILKGEEG